MSEDTVPELLSAEDLEKETAAELASFNEVVADISDAPVTPTEPEVLPAVAVAPIVQPEPPVVDLDKLARDAQFQDLLAKVGTVDQLNANLEKFRGDAFGKIGGLERTLKAIQDATPLGQAIEVTDKDLEEIREEFPDLTTKLAKGLTRVLSRMKGTGSAAPAFTQADVDARVEARVVAERSAFDQKLTERDRLAAAERLTDRHEDWQAVVGPKDSTTSYRTWLHEQEPGNEQAILNTWDARVISKSLDRFKAYQAAQAPAPAVPVMDDKQLRAQRLAAAIPARGGAAAPVQPGEKSLQDAFKDGFNS